MARARRWRARRFCRGRGRHGCRRAVAQPSVAAHRLESPCGWPLWRGWSPRDGLAGGSGIGIRRRRQRRGWCAGPVRGARPAHRPRRGSRRRFSRRACRSPASSLRPSRRRARGLSLRPPRERGPLLIKVLGSDERDADLLYRAYRFIRLRDIGDTRPAASLIQAVEHEALAAVMAERAGVAVPAVRQVIKTADGSALLVMEHVDGCSLDLVPVQGMSDAMLGELWKQVDGLHRARIAHRSLRAANIMVDRARQALDRRLQLLRAGPHAAPDGARRRRAAGLAGSHGWGRPGGRRRRCGHWRGRRRGGGVVAAAACSFGRYPPGDRPP